MLSGCPPPAADGGTTSGTGRATAAALAEVLAAARADELVDYARRFTAAHGGAGIRMAVIDRDLAARVFCIGGDGQLALRNPGVVGVGDCQATLPSVMRSLNLERRSASVWAVAVSTPAGPRRARDGRPYLFHLMAVVGAGDSAVVLTRQSGIEREAPLAAWLAENPRLGTLQRRYTFHWGATEWEDWDRCCFDFVSAQ